MTLILETEKARITPGLFLLMQIGPQLATLSGKG